MNPSLPIGVCRGVVLLLASPFVQLSSAQTAPAATTTPPPADEGTITLAAFEVSTDRDVGYTASSALAGGRIDTPLKETPSAISVLTAEFLEDIGATSFGSAAEWAPNSIPVGETATFGDYNTNIRGVGNSFPSRNYFRWYVSSDSYNTERLEFARGPNSILFGDGNPGGINTTWTKQALFTKRGSVQLRADSEGGYRAALDYNQPAGDKLAVRLNAVTDRLKGWRDYDEPVRDSIHVAATYRLAKDTQFRGEFEDGRYRRFGFAQTFADQSSNWNRTTIYDGVTPPPTAGTGVGRLNAAVADDYLVQDPNQPSLGLMNLRGFYQTTGTGLRILPDGRPIPRFPVLPSREFSLQPPDAYLDTRYKTWSFYLEHRFRAGLIAQLAYNHQDQARKGNIRVWDQNRIDVNTVLPGGVPNPNFGKAFADVQPQRQLQENELSDWRLSLAYKKQFSWLRESLSVVAGLRSDEFNNYVWTAGRVNGTNPNATVATSRTPSATRRRASTHSRRRSTSEHGRGRRKPVSGVPLMWFEDGAPCDRRPARFVIYWMTNRVRGRAQQRRNHPAAGKTLRRAGVTVKRTGFGDSTMPSLTVAPLDHRLQPTHETFPRSPLRRPRGACCRGPRGRPG